MQFPIILKPAFGSASAFVIKIKDESELLPIYEYIRQNISTHPDSADWDTLDILAEEYIEGDEVDIDITLQNGKIKFYSITDNYKTNEPFFIETGQSIPSNLPQEDQQGLIDMAEEALEKFGIQNGIIHFEAKTNSSGATPIEINLRLGGDEVYSFVKSAWGVDLIENAAKIALGIYIKRILNPGKPKEFLAGTSFFSDHSGVLVKFNNDRHIEKRKFVEEFHFYKKIGDTVLVPPEGYEYLGWLTASGENSIDAQENLDWAVKQIKYTVAKFDHASSLGKTSQRNNFSSAYLTKKMLSRAIKLEQIKWMSPKNLKKLRIGLAYVSNDDVGKNGTHNIKKGISYIEKILAERGYKVTLFNFSDVSKIYPDLKTTDINLMLFINEDRKTFYANYQITSLLDLLQIPYAGSDFSTLSLCNNKVRVNKILAFNNIPLPEWDYITDINEELDEDLQFPLLVNPLLAYDDNSAVNEIVVKNKAELQKALKKIVVDQKKYALVEQCVEGDEYEISILGNDEIDIWVLPLTRHKYNASSGTYTIQIPPKNVNKKLSFFIVGSLKPSEHRELFNIPLEDFKDECENFDILMTDFRMPPMESISNGIELIRFIKLNKINPEMKIILMSAEMDENIKSVALAAGADKVMNKFEICGVKTMEKLLEELFFKNKT